MSIILLVEDDENHVNLICRMLHDDYPVVSTEDGERALELVSSEHPDLIILDLRLGPLSIDGFEVNRRLKADPNTAAIPVIALTAGVLTDAERGELTTSGFVETVDKALGYNQLARAVAGILGTPPTA